MSQPALRSQQVAAHGVVAREEVFDRPRQAVAGVGHAVGRRRAFVEHESRGVFSAATLERFFVDAGLAPSAGFPLRAWEN